MAGLRKVLLSTVPGILNCNRTSTTTANTHCIVFFGFSFKPILRSLSRYYSSSESPDIYLSNEENKRLLFNRRVAKNLDSHVAAETGATLGQPWVREWDDFKKSKDGPFELEFL